MKTAGAFSVANYGEGSYCILLVQHFLERNTSLRKTSSLSFKATDMATSKEFEADLGLLWQASEYGEAVEGVLFAECKSYNLFTDADFARMRQLKERFPGAILAFCTLRKTLEPTEITELSRLHIEGMEQWKTERPRNPVLILTQRELMSDFGAPSCWKDLAVPDWVKRAHSMLELCNATQAIYLNAPDWGTTWSKTYEAERRRRRMQIAQRRSRKLRIPMMSAGHSG